MSELKETVRTVTQVVAVAVVIRHVSHRVVLRNVFRVCLDELLGRIPKGRYRGTELVHRNCEP